LELGHIISRNGKRLENNIGKQGILDLGALRLSEWKGETVISREKPISATEMVVEASNGDAFCQSVFYEVGEILGEGLVALIRILDVSRILIGGGLSASWDFVKPGTEKVLAQWLPPYYLDKLTLAKAALGNDAGLLGAASLCL
jgi:glucokinase